MSPADDLATLRGERMFEFADLLDCRRCGGSGWVTVVDGDGYGDVIPCPEGCPTSGKAVPAT